MPMKRRHSRLNFGHIATMIGPCRLGRFTALAIVIAAAASMARSPAVAADSSIAEVPAPDLRGGWSELSIENGQPGTASRLDGADSRLQLIVSARDEISGRLQDQTRSVRYATDPPGIVAIDDDGLVTPLRDGTVRVTASWEGLRAEGELTVAGIGDERPLSFPGQIVPIFTKLGCNGGGCHGKIAGQNGFKLSLLGFEPREDYEFLVRESRGRRVFPAAPDHSLLLRKAVNSSPHGGGQRLQEDSHEYRMLRRWIAQGMPYGTGQEPRIESLEIFPAHRRLSPGVSQQLAVVAVYDDGTTEDVTRGAVFESNDPQMADVTTTGLVRLGQLVGDVAVMARYQGHVTVFRADLPLDGALAGSGNAEDATASPAWPRPRNVVDEHVFAKLRSLGIPPSDRCDDATYQRRITLDVVGRLPTVEEIERFAADQADDKRDRLLDRLLESEDHAEYFASKWNAILRNRRQGDQPSFANVAFHGWIRDSLYENKPYDRFVRELLTASGSVASNPAVVWYRQVPDTNQRLEDAAQLFLGQRIQCARCHHHPFEKWGQDDYARMAAFFSRVAKKNEAVLGGPRFVSTVGAARAPHPKTGQSLSPAGLAAEPLEMAETDDPRQHLVDWMVEPGNPFFAKALVNRYWKHFMGRGLVEPEDDLRLTNPPSNPELLDGLAEAFVRSGYDLRALIRLIGQSNAYSLQSDPDESNLADRRAHSRFYPKRLTAEVLLDAVDRVCGTQTPFAGMPAGTRAVALPDPGFDSYFLTVFGRPRGDTACECERSQEANLAQSLHLLNSEEIQQKLADPTGRAAQMSAEDERGDEDKIRELFAVAYARSPSPQELETLVGYLSDKSDRQAAYEDVIWSVINSKEFLFNH